MTLAARLMGTGLPAAAALQITGDVGSSLTAAGTTQATALQLSNGVNVLTTVASGTGVILYQHANKGDEQTIYNLGANSVTVYPPVGETIQGFAANAGYTILSGGVDCLEKVNNTTWVAKESFVPSGTGATTRTVQAKLRELVTSGDYDTAAHAVTAATANYSGAFTAQTANIHRLRDRVFIGNAAQFAGANLTLPDTGGTAWLQAVGDGPTFLPTNGQFVVLTDTGKYAIVGGSKASLNTGGGSQAIGVAGLVINDLSGASAWALYADIQHSSSGVSYAFEGAVKNASSSNLTITPYTATNGAFGTWMAGGGDDSYGTASANPSNAAHVIIKGAQTWNKGIVFMATAITGATGTVGDTGTGPAINLGRRQSIRWNEPTNDSIGFEIVSSITATANKVSIDANDNNILFLASNGVAMGFVNASGTVANYAGFVGRPTGTAAQIQTKGDTDVDLWFNLNGAGLVRFGTKTGAADAASDGYVTIKDAAGNTIKLATRA